jgi:hypothetical protein
MKIRNTALGAALFLSATSALAQTQPATLPTTKPTVLDTLGNDQLMTELAARGMDNLLDRFFELNHVPDARRKAVKILGTLGELTDPNSKLTPSQRSQLARQIAENVDLILSGINDPAKLMGLANAIIENAITHDVNTLEYWGQNAAIRARLRPLASAVYKLLGRAAELAGNQANQLAAQIKSADDAKADLWVKLDEIARNGKYQQNMSAYYMVLATEPDDPSRRKMADDASTYLDTFDNADSNVQARVRNMKGKLALARGGFKEAKRIFATVANADKAKNRKEAITPPPNPFELYEARYFSAVADVQARDLPAAQEDLKSISAWEKDSFPKLLAQTKLDVKATEDAVKGVDAAVQMLGYRIHLLEGELAKSPEEKQKADKAAETVLLDLRKNRPELAPVIDEQLSMLVPENRPVSQLNTLMLQGVMSRGTAEYKKSDDEKPNLRVMQRAIDAAKEILSRQGKDKDVTLQVTADATILIPTLLDRAGHPVEAVNGYLDYDDKFQKLNPKIAGEALDRAGYLVFEMKKHDPAPPGFSEAYGRFLRTAIAPPFNHKELAYLMGEHLQAQGKEADALPFYQQVPKESPSYLNAQYKSMLCLRDLLDENASPQQHKQYAEQLLKSAGVVKELGAASKDQFDRAKAVQSTLVYAQLARTEQKDPNASLKTLDGFDSLVKGLPGEKGLLNEALFERVQAQMDLGKFDQATALLVDLLNKTEGNEGMGLVSQLLDELDQQFQKADIAHDNDKMRTIARNEAQLTGFLGDWAKNNKDPNISRFYYAYMVYDARTKRLAATLTDEPAERKNLLEQTLKLYQNLQTPAMHDLYVKTLDPKKIAAGDINPKDSDPSVQIGVAFTDFELGDYKSTQAILGDLLANQKLGPPTLVEQSADGVKTKVNDLYWEATYKLLKSNAEIAKASNDKTMMANTVRGLKVLLIRGGIPTRWEDEFESLRKDIAPDFTPATNPAVRK